MSIDKLRKKIIDFRDERNWKQFHNIKDLLLGLNIEVSELSELFLWKDGKETALVKKERIKEEVADIFIYITYICEHFDIDLVQAVDNKLKLNEKKYPVHKSYNSNKKYDEL